MNAETVFIRRSQIEKIFWRGAADLRSVSFLSTPPRSLSTCAPRPLGRALASLRWLLVSLCGAAPRTCANAVM